MSTWRKLVYSGGAVGSSLGAQALGAYLFFFYVDVSKMAPAVVGYGLALYSLWNAINDPVLGFLSDRTRTRWGRRIPYVLAGVVPLGIAFYLVWSPHLFFGEGRPTLAYFLAVTFAFDFFYTLVVLNWTALFPEMFPSLEERAQVSAWRQVFGLIGLAGALGGAPLVYSTLGWPAMGVLFGALTAIPLALSMLGAKEDPTRRGQDVGLDEALARTLVNGSFVSFALTSFLIQLVFGLLLAALPFYVKYVLRLEPVALTFIQVGLILVTLVSLLVWRRFTVAWGPKRAMQRSIGLFTLLLVLFWFPNDLTSAVAAAAAVGTGLGGILLLLDVLLSDVIDEDAVKSGARREGMYFGVHALIIRLNISAQGFIQSAVLTATGYDAELAVQPASAVLGMRLLMTAIPIGVSLLALLALHFYPLAGERLREMKERLQERERLAGREA
ncbi:MFS transporter [Limnochorda pilosa]|uniref:Sodium:melibiose symporter n=1 Tax=Limnochorda pilosa TaxID=1555112 RepID=A0A0K2SGZ9_LIMPI|nr:MFS transporter [Limnochorda pilosa]BAS26104.1 sodium:melibiose symporter [Limnochorda pilosa]